ncbi:MAG: hypothetical protein ACRERV_04920 [Methylococcales bacterium]
MIKKDGKFSTPTRQLLETLVAAIYEARGSPPDTPLTETFCQRN